MTSYLLGYKPNNGHSHPLRTVHLAHSKMQITTWQWLMVKM